MPTAYVIRADRPFPGYVQTIVNDDGTVGHDRHPSIEAYAASLPFPVRAVTWEELEPMVNAFRDSRVTDPVEITAERWDDMLNVMPPMRWGHTRGVEHFAICEAQTHDLHDWFCRIGDRHFTFVDCIRRPSGEIAAKAAAAL